MKNHRIAVIGLGDMGSSHTMGFDRLQGCDVVATVDPAFDESTTHAYNWSGPKPPHYKNHLQMLSEVKPDCCVIAVPDYLHREVSHGVLDAGCDLFLEKPISTTIEDTDAILVHAKKTNRVLQIGLVYRYSNLYRGMARLGHDPKHPVSYMWCKEFRQCFPQKPWFYSQAKTGGTIVEKDCHHFDIFNWVIASPPTRVFAMGGQHVYKSGSLVDCSYCPDPPRVIEEIDTVDHAIVSVEYENGARAVLMLCMYLRPENVMPEGLELGAICKSGRQICAYKDERLTVGGVGEPLQNIRLDMLADNDAIGHIGAQQQRREFLECVRTRSTPFADGVVGRNSMLVALAAEMSIMEGRAIDLKEFPPCPI